MKNIIKSIVATALVLGFTSCEDEQDLIYSQPVGAFKILSPISGDGVVLSALTPTNPGLVLNWEAANYGTPTVITYSVEVDKSGDDFDTPLVITTTNNTYAAITSEVLNSAALGSGLIPFTADGLDVRIKSTVGTTASQPQYSTVISYIVTPYSTDLPKLYVVGNFLSAGGYGSDWSPGSAVPIASSAFGATDFEGFVNFNQASFEYKFLPTNTSFNDDYGDDGSFSGTLVQTGEMNCIGTGAGYYRVRANTTALSYSLEITRWAITGSATPLNWPAGPGGTPGQDHDMTYNQTTKKWEIIIALTAGGNEFKFRANDNWTINFGGDGSDPDESLDYDGPNLSVPTAGNYKIELDLSNPRDYKYTATLQ